MAKDIAVSGDAIKRCVSCGLADSQVSLYALSQSLAICDKCVESGVFSGRVFFDLLYVIQLRLRQSAKALRQSVVRRDGQVGWYHYLNEDNIGLSSTAYALALLKQLDPTFPDLRRAADTVRGAFIRDSNADEGGWPMASIPGQILTEPTCYCAGQLVAAGFLEIAAPEVEGAVRWLVREQQPDDGWAPHTSLSSNSYVTALVVRALADWSPGLTGMLREQAQEAVARGSDWLIKSAQSGGGWGPTAQSPSDPWHTAHSLAALSAAGNDGGEHLITLAIESLLASREQWSRVITASYEIQVSGRVARANYVFHPRPIVVQALLRSGVSPQHPAIVTSIVETLSAQDPESGKWLYPGATRGTIFELCHNAVCLREFAERSSSVGSLVELHYQLNRLEAKVDAVVANPLRPAGSVESPLEASKRPVTLGHLGLLLALSAVSLFLSALPITGIVLPTRTVGATSLFVAAGAWLLFRLILSRTTVTRVFYSLLLGLVVLAACAVVFFDVQTLLFSIVVAVAVASAQLLAPLVLPALKGS